MTRYRYLLAKGWDPASSPTPPAEVRLLPHLRAVQAAAQSIVAVRGATILENLDLDASLWLPRLRLALSLAALLHDLGKANSYFQGMVRGKRDFPPYAQPIRHELVSVLILLRNSSGIADWLRNQLREAEQSSAVDEMFQTVVGAVAGHHVKMTDDWRKVFPAEARPAASTSIALLLGHDDLRPLFGAAHPTSDESWSLLKSKHDKPETYPGRSQHRFNSKSISWKDQLDAKPQWKRFAAAVKALTVGADVAGSALLPKGVSIKAWVGEALSHSAPAQTLRQVAIARLDDRPARPFQLNIAASTAAVTLVEAGCGSGKTAAAYLWAASRASGRKLFFCYPTTGTATEGFLGYVDKSDVEAELIHSRAAVDLERVAMSLEDRPQDEAEDQQIRVLSLNAWIPQVVICTIDTVLALPRNNRRGLYGSAALLSGCFVFDEVHAYDDAMFSALVALIQAMPGTPCLLMSASLTKQRKEFLHRKLSAVATIAPPAELEAIRRYRIERADFSTAFDKAIASAASGEHVLWVSNRVDRAQALFERAQAAGVPVACYHSRFCYHDRADRHREVVDGFSGCRGAGLLALTTQVAEMSLDLDANLLVTELAPVPALIQRLGRLNRGVSEADHGQPREALVVEPQDDTPYRRDTDWRSAANAWLDRLVALGRPLSQQDLAEQFRDVETARPQRLELTTEWLDSGWCAAPAAIREPGFTVNVILPDDLAACQANRTEIIGRSLPMPYRNHMEEWSKLHGAFVAPPGVIEYDQYKGAVWTN